MNIFSVTGIIASIVIAIVILAILALIIPHVLPGLVACCAFVGGMPIMYFLFDAHYTAEMSDLEVFGLGLICFGCWLLAELLFNVIITLPLFILCLNIEDARKERERERMNERKYGWLA